MTSYIIPDGTFELNSYHSNMFITSILVHFFIKHYIICKLDCSEEICHTFVGLMNSPTIDIKAKP